MSITPSINIVLARMNKEDDIIRILPIEQGQDLYSVTYEDRWSKQKYYFEDTWEEVSAYLAQIFAVLPVDRDPYEGVQFLVPAYPSIWIKTTDTTTCSVMDPIWDILDTVARAWPARIRNPQPESSDSDSDSDDSGYTSEASSVTI